MPVLAPSCIRLCLIGGQRSGGRHSGWSARVVRGTPGGSACRPAGGEAAGLAFRSGRAVSTLRGARCGVVRDDGRTERVCGWSGYVRGWDCCGGRAGGGWPRGRFCRLRWCWLCARSVRPRAASTRNSAVFGRQRDSARAPVGFQPRADLLAALAAPGRMSVVPGGDGAARGGQGAPGGRSDIRHGPHGLTGTGGATPWAAEGGVLPARCRPGSRGS